MTAHPADSHPTTSPHHDRHPNILALTLAAQFMVTFDAVVLTVALPSIQTGLGFSDQLNLQGVITAYVLFFCGFLLLGGRAVDLFGRQRLFLIGLALLTGAFLVNGLANDPITLVMGLGVQGLGATLTSPAVASIIIVTFRTTAERVRALGFLTTVTAGASAAGVLIGSLLTDHASWRWIFLVNIPVGLIGIAGALRIIPSSEAKAGDLHRTDLPGATGGPTVPVTAVADVQAPVWCPFRPALPRSPLCRCRLADPRPALRRRLLRPRRPAQHAPDRCMRRPGATCAFMVVTTGSPVEESGLASGVLNTSQQLSAAPGFTVTSFSMVGRTARPPAGAGDRGFHDCCAVVRPGGRVHSFDVAVAAVFGALIAMFGRLTRTSRARPVPRAAASRK